MKRSLIRTGILLSAVFATPAFAAPTVYGKLNLSLDMMDDGEDQAYGVNSHASRVGVKGSEELDGGLIGIYKYEFEVKPGNSGKDDANLTARNQYVGVKGGFGQLIYGRHDSPAKASQGKVDVFGDSAGDIKSLTSAEDRFGGVVGYKAPLLVEGLDLNLAILPGADKEGEEGLAGRGLSASAVYKAGAVYAALGLDSAVNDGGKERNTTRITLGYKLGALALGFIADSEEVDEADAETMMAVSAKYKLNDTHSVKLQFGQSDIKGKDLIALGLDHKLGKKTSHYVNLVQLSDTEAETDVTTFELGLIQKF